MSTRGIPHRINPRRTARLAGYRVTPDTKIMFYMMVATVAVLMMWILNIHV